MTSKTVNPAPLAKATGLGFVSCSAASDIHEIAKHLASVQTNFVARRTRLSPDLARVVAAHVFGSAA